MRRHLAGLVAMSAPVAVALAGCGSSAVRTVTVHAAAPAPIVKTVVKTKTIVKHERVEVPVAKEAAPSTATPSTAPDCNNLPAAGSTNLREIRESRCEIEKLNAEHPSAANEHEIETMITDERAVEASEH